MDHLVAGCFAGLYWFFVDFVGYFVGRLTISLVSFGRAFARPFGSPPVRFNWLGYRRDESGRIEVAEDVAGYIGLAIMIACLSIILMVHQF